MVTSTPILPSFCIKGNGFKAIRMAMASVPFTELTILDLDLIAFSNVIIIMTEVRIMYSTTTCLQ